jgi:hypothetical protein
MPVGMAERPRGGAGGRDGMAEPSRPASPDAQPAPALEEEEEEEEDIERFLATSEQTPRKKETGGRQQPWKHGEILFEDTRTVTKLLLVPDHIEDPEEILQVMLGDWGMPMPNMTISVSSAPGDYFHPVWNDSKDSENPFPSVWGSSAEAKAAASEDTDWQEDANDQNAARDKFALKMTQMMYGICRAAGECKGWLVSPWVHRTGGDNTGAIIDPVSALLTII